MHDYINILADNNTSEQAWSENFDALFIGQINEQRPDYEEMLDLYGRLPDDRKNWLLELILESDIPYISRFAEETFGKSISRSQVLYSYRDKLNLSRETLQEIEKILDSDTKSSISQTILRGRTTHILK